MPCGLFSSHRHSCDEPFFKDSDDSGTAACWHSTLLPPAAGRCKEPFQYYDYEHISDKEMFDEYCQGIKNYSLYDTGLTAGYREELVTLCTCSYSGKDQRLLVVGRRLY